MAFLTELLEGTAGDVTVSIYASLIISGMHIQPPHPPPNPSPSWITILSNIFIGIDWGSKAMREQTGCFCEEKVNEMSYKRWDFFQAAQVVAADATLKQSSLMGTLTQLSLICWFAECIGCIFTMLWCY